MKTKIFYILLLLTITTFVYFYDTPKSNTLTKCPEDYPKTETGLREQKTDTNKWASDFEAKNPDASLYDLAKARYKFYAENNCVATIKKYSGMKTHEGETEQEKVMRETIQEEIQNQSIENLTNALKDDKQKQ